MSKNPPQAPSQANTTTNNQTGANTSFCNVANPQASSASSTQRPPLDTGLPTTHAQDPSKTSPSPTPNPLSSAPLSSSSLNIQTNPAEQPASEPSRTDLNIEEDDDLNFEDLMDQMIECESCEGWFEERQGKYDDEDEESKSFYCYKCWVEYLEGGDEDIDDEVARLEEEAEQLREEQEKIDATWEELQGCENLNDNGSPPRHEGSSDQINNAEKLFVGELPDDISEIQLERYFGKFGRILECSVTFDASQSSRRFAFVTFADPAVVDKILDSGPHRIPSPMSVEIELLVERATSDGQYDWSNGDDSLTEDQGVDDEMAGEEGGDVDWMYQPQFGTMIDPIQAYGPPVINPNGYPMQPIMYPQFAYPPSQVGGNILQPMIPYQPILQQPYRGYDRQVAHMGGSYEMQFRQPAGPQSSCKRRRDMNGFSRPSKRVRLDPNGARSKN